MKTRQGFVSNSSSASFVVALNMLTQTEIDTIMAYEEITKCGRYNDSWIIWINQDKGVIQGCTSMDNEDFSNYLENNDIDAGKFVWDSY